MPLHRTIWLHNRIDRDLPQDAVRSEILPLTVSRLVRILWHVAEMPPEAFDALGGSEAMRDTQIVKAGPYDARWRLLLLAVAFLVPLSSCKEGPKCQGSTDCKELGLCTVKGDKCVVSSDKDCRGTAVCIEKGKCSAREGECVVAKDADCQITDNCGTKGACSARGSAAAWPAFPLACPQPPSQRKRLRESAGRRLQPGNTAPPPRARRPADPRRDARPYHVAASPRHCGARPATTSLCYSIATNTEHRSATSRA